MLNEILDDEVKFFGLPADLGSEADASKLTSLKDQVVSLKDQSSLKIKSNPLMMVARTHYLMGKVLSNMSFEKANLEY